MREEKSSSMLISTPTSPYHSHPEIHPKLNVQFSKLCSTLVSRTLLKDVYEPAHFWTMNNIWEKRSLAVCDFNTNIPLSLPPRNPTQTKCHSFQNSAQHLLAEHCLKMFMNQPISEQWIKFERREVCQWCDFNTNIPLSLPPRNPPKLNVTVFKTRSDTCSRTQLKVVYPPAHFWKIIKLERREVGQYV